MELGLEPDIKETPKPKHEAKSSLIESQVNNVGDIPNNLNQTSNTLMGPQIDIKTYDKDEPVSAIIAKARGPTGDISIGAVLD